MQSDPPNRLRHLRAQLAPGTPLREGLERILKGRTGALVVLGHTKAVDQVSTGGFVVEAPFTPQNLRELAKMDGAIVVDNDVHRIVSAAVHMVPDSSIETWETGTRHRSADRVSKQTGVPTVTVSASMSTITLFVDGQRHPVEHPAQILSRANMTLQTLERYRARLTQLTQRLSALEVEDQVTLRDLTLVAQRLELVRRLEAELSGYVLELGTDGRLLDLQLRELNIGIEDLATLITLDYLAHRDPAGSLGALHTLSMPDLLDPGAVSRAMGYLPTDHLETRLTARGLRQLAQIPRLPHALAPRLLDHFGSLQSLFGASSAELQSVDGVGESRAKLIRDGLTRLAESAYTEQLH